MSKTNFLKQHKPILHIKSVNLQALVLLMKKYAYVLKIVIMFVIYIYIKCWNKYNLEGIKNIQRRAKLDHEKKRG